MPVGNELAQVIHAALNAEISTPTNRKALVNRLFDAAQNLAADELQRVIEVDDTKWSTSKAQLRIPESMRMVKLLVYRKVFSDAARAPLAALCTNLGGAWMFGKAPTIINDGKIVPLPYPVKAEMLERLSKPKASTTQPKPNNIEPAAKRQRLD